MNSKCHLFTNRKLLQDGFIGYDMPGITVLTVIESKNIVVII